jgi:signal transduction histidine kinase
MMVERMRTRIAADLHDDIASSLSSVALYSDILGRELRAQPGDVPVLLSRISALSREVMSNISLIVWAVDPRRDELAEVFQYFQRHAAQLCSAVGVSFVARLPDETKSIALTPDERRMVFLILKEALNNALKHSHCSHIFYACRIVDHTMEMTLQDDGKGFSPGDRTQGHGLQNMLARASTIGAQVAIDSNPGRGTTLQLSMRIA